MWAYEKKLQYPVKIATPDPHTAQIIISQLGGADGEMAASMRYLHQRYSMPNKKVAGLLTDIGTEELAHLEMIGAILYQLTRNIPEEQIAGTPFATYFVDHTTGVYPIAASGVPFDMKYVGIKGDVIADLNEDLAADVAIPQAQPAYLERRKQLRHKIFHDFGKVGQATSACYRIRTTIGKNPLKFRKIKQNGKSRLFSPILTN